MYHIVSHTERGKLETFSCYRTPQGAQAAAYNESRADRALAKKVGRKPRKWVVEACPINGKCLDNPFK